MLAWIYLLGAVVIWLVLYRPVRDWSITDRGELDRAEEVMVGAIVTIVAVAWPVFAFVLIVRLATKLLDEAV